MAKKSYTRLILMALFTLVVTFAVMFSVINADGVASAAVKNSDIINIAGQALSDEDINAIKGGFAVKAEGKNLGVAGEVSAARDIILYVDYGDTDKSRVIYNFAEKDYYIVDTEFYSAYTNDDNFRRLGAPVTDKSTFTLSGKSKSATLTAGSYTAQIFETGVLVQNGANVDMYVGAVETKNNGYVIHPVIDDQDIMKKGDGGLEYFGNVDGEMHPLKDADFLASGTGYKLYANYRSCCVYVEYNADYSIKKQLIYAARNYFNISNEYATKILPSECYSVRNLVCDGANPVDGDALAYYKSFQPDGTSDDLIALFADCYNDLITEGYVAGYRCSKIKMWDLLVLDLKFGDGTTGFSATGTGDRERMTCMVYNPAQNKVYPVNNAFFLVFKEDNGIGRKALGYPESKVMSNKKIGDVTYKEIQIYQNGYIYKTEQNNCVGVIGYNYDATNNVFYPVATPDVPDRYGAEISREVKDGAIYINYEKGAIKCQPTVNGSKYYYSYYSGRNFDFVGSFDAKILAMDKLLNYNQLVQKGAMPFDKNYNEIDFDSVIKPMLYAKYTELFRSGYFCGFVEEEFKGAWNNVFAQQFVAGDSTSMIFGEERPFVSALVYNPRTNAVYLLKNDVIKTWQANYATAGAPTSDEYQVDGCDYWFQTFDFGMTIRNGNLIAFTEDFESPAAYVAEMKNNQLSFPTHNNNQLNGYIG